MDRWGDGCNRRAQAGAGDDGQPAGHVEETVQGAQAVRVGHQPWDDGLQRRVEHRLDPGQRHTRGDQKRQVVVAAGRRENREGARGHPAIPVSHRERMRAS